MASRRPAGAHAAGRAGGQPTPRFALSPDQNARFDNSAADVGQGPRRAVHAPRGPGATSVAVRRASNRTHRHRYAARPWVFILPVVAAGALLHQIPPARALWWIVLILGLLYAALIHYPRNKTAPKPHLWYGIACIVAAAAWLSIVDACGMFAGIGRIAIIFIAVPGFWPLSWLWWQYHRVRPLPERREERPAAPAPDPNLHAWADHVSRPGGYFPGATLVPASEVPGAKTYLIRGVRGTHTTKQLMSDDARDKYAGALGIDPERIHLEKPLDGPDRNGRNARLLVLDASNPQLLTQIDWQGPTLDVAAGTWVPGVYPDTPARCMLYQVNGGVPHRALNEAIAGLMGKGKSRLIELGVAERLWSGFTCVWYGDGQEGASAPGLRDHVDWYATNRDEILKMLKAALKILLARQQNDRTIRWTDSHGHPRTGRGFWPASADEPFLQVILDECQELLNDIRIAKIVKTLQRLGPKFGIGVTLSTQEWLMWETGGASGDPSAQTIRTFAQTGLVALFKSGSDINADALGGSMANVNPRELPDEPGWCYLIGPGMRPVPVRLSLIDQDDLYDWLARATSVKARLDQLAVMAAGEDYATRWERLDSLPTIIDDEVLADLDQRVAELLGEQLADGPIPPSNLDLTIREAVLNVVRDHPGPVARADIPALLADVGKQSSKSGIDQALASWQRTGQLVKISHGVWAAADYQDRQGANAEAHAAQYELSGQPDA